MCSWFLYILRCGDGTYYTGVTTDVERRLLQHQRGKGAKYTKGRGPITLQRCWWFASQGEALRAELRMKSRTRDQKELCIQDERFHP